MLNIRQNFSKRDPSKLTLRRALKVPAGHKFVSVDSSQIEARMLAYAAREDELVGHFRDGRDPYAELAEKIFGISAKEIHDGAKSGDKKLKNFRNVGKTCILSAGYSVGPQRFSDTLLRQGVRLSDDLAQHHELAKQAHQIYRLSNRMIVAFWDECQRVIEAMESGAEGWFGGPDGKLFHYMQASLPGHEDKIPCIVVGGSEYRLWYPNLRWEKGEKRVEYFYDRVRGKNQIKTKLYGGSLTENCCKRGTLVLTNHGWKPIEAVSIDDMVYDGTSFVHHSGVVSKGVQDCIEVNGCWFTSDHLLMENGAWTYAKDCKRPDRIEVRKACSGLPYQLGESAMAVGISLRLRSHSGEGRQRSSESCEAWQHAAMSSMCKEGYERAYPDAWDDKNAHICGMAFYGTALYRAYASSLGTLRRAWHYSLRTLAKVRELSRRYGKYISERVGLGQDRQQCWVFAGELPLGNATGKCEEWSQLSDYRRGGIVQADRHKSVNHILSACSRVARSTDSSHKAESREHKAALVQRQAIKREEVFDILNCGERHCFTVMGDYPMLAHNCIQSLAFMLLGWQACRMNLAGVPLIANIHDAWLSCVPESNAEETMKLMEHWMSSVPSWLEGFPVACEGEIGDSYEIA